MKMLIRLTFIGMLISAYSAADPLSRCNIPTTIMDGFEAPKFHSGGNWYVSHVTSSKSECQTLTVSQAGDKSIVQHPYQGGTLRCKAQAEALRRLTFDCRKDGQAVDRTIFIVLDTDYSDYALYYLCTSPTSNPEQLAENYLVARRTAGQTTIPAALTSLTGGMNLQPC